MLTQRNIESLEALRIPAMAQAYAEQMADPRVAGLSFGERLGMTVQDSRGLLEILDDVVATRSTIIASQIPLEHQHETLADPTVADAILDRIVQASHRIGLAGEFMRKALANVQHEELNNA